MPGFIGLPEIILFGIVALLIFGPKRLPEMGRSLGKGMREFKDSVSSSDAHRAGDSTQVIDMSAEHAGTGSLLDTSDVTFDKGRTDAAATPVTVEPAPLAR